MSSTRKRMRLPNGFGRITQIKGKNLRKPWRVRVTVGVDSNGRPIAKPLQPQTYFETYNDAYTALIKYHEDPYDLGQRITMAELYDRWSESHFTEVSDSTKYQYIAAWKYCEKIKGIAVRDIRAWHIKDCCENGRNLNGDLARPNTRAMVKTLCSLLLAYAIENGWAENNYAKDVRLSKATRDEIRANKVDHTAFSDEELSLMWSSIDKIPNLDMLLMQCYMGWRPNEMLGIKLENIDLGRKNIIGGMKTSAGINRTVPIHSLIYPMVERRYKQAMKSNSTFLFPGMKQGTQMSYSHYYSIFKEVIDASGLDVCHRPHDPRKTFVTNAKKYNVDEYAIKLIVGHHIDDITERIYCERDITWLHTEIEKIRKPSCYT